MAVSYCRAGDDSDVYLIGTTNEALWCCGCDKEGAVTRIKEEMLKHLYQHRADGEKVPEYAIQRLKQEILCSNCPGCKECRNE